MQNCLKNSYCKKTVTSLNVAAFLFCTYKLYYYVSAFISRPTISRTSSPGDFCPYSFSYSSFVPSSDQSTSSSSFISFLLNEIFGTLLIKIHVLELLLFSFYVSKIMYHKVYFSVHYSGSGESSF